MINGISSGLKTIVFALWVVGLLPFCVSGQTLPLVAVHDSELTRALETRAAVAPTPTGTGTTGFEWWPTDWHYFVMPESVKEALRSDGTAYTTIGDSNITAGVLLTNGAPKYPVVISFASEAIRNDEIAPLTNYVAAGGFLVVGSSAFTRNTNGTTRGDFAIANQLGLHMVIGGLTNWTVNTTFLKTNDSNHRLVSHIPDGSNTWRMPSSSEEIPWGISPSHPFLAPHDLWRVQASGATILAVGDAYPFIAFKQYGKGYFIYIATMQPLIGHGGFAPNMYAYMILRRAIEWAFENANLPVPKLSPWPYQYDAAFMVRHDLENFTNEIANIELSAGFEYTNGAKGDYYFCTGTLRDDAAPGGYSTNSIVASLRRAVTNFGATLGPHNGGLKNPNNPSLVRGQYDYWHWGLDEALDVTPAGYSSGKAYALTSLTNSFRDIEGWLQGITLPPRTWVACYFNATREDSYDVQVQAGVKITGDQKICPFPTWTLSTVTPGKRWPMLTQPVSDWFVGGLVAQSLEPWHFPGVQNNQTLQQSVDFYYNQGFLINFYSHTMSTGLGDAGQLVPNYITYCMNTNLHPRMWPANAVGVYQWWLQRSNAQVTATCATNASQTITTFSIKGATSTNTAVEVLVPAAVAVCNLQVFTNGVLAGPTLYRTNGQIIRVRVGTTVTNAVVSYFPLSPIAPIFSESFDGASAPALPEGWTTSSSGGQSPWVSTTGTNVSAPLSVFSPDSTNAGVNELVSPVIALPIGQAQLSFQQLYDLENGGGTTAFDGGVLEIKIGTNAFADIIAAGGSWINGGYADTIVTNFGNPLAGRDAWSGASDGFVTASVNLPTSASGQNVQFRWRCGTDSGTGHTGWRIDGIALTSRSCMCCGSTNSAPTLPTLSNRTVAELVSLTVTNTASDSDVPPDASSYLLLNPPAGASIDSAGVITWTPSEAQGPGTFALTTIVTDDGFPALSDTNSFNVTVTEVNSAPSLPVQNNRTIAELTALTVTNNATDSDLPANTLTYSLLAAPAGAGISSGVITWTPTEAQGLSTNIFTTRVADNGSPPLSATNTFTVVVTEVNTAPVLPGQANRTIAALTSFTVTNAATDGDLPANTLLYVLTNGPSGAAISAAGIITWTPSAGQDHTTNLFRTVATDNGSPPLSVTNSFTVVVNGDPQIVLDSTTLALEGCSPTNNAIDPGEGVTMLFALKNTGLGNTMNLTVTLLATNGVSSPSGPINYGALIAGGGPASQPFTFSATGACGGTVTAVLQFQDGALNLGTASLALPLGLLTTVLTQSFDAVTAPALPAGWSTTSSGAQTAWVTQSAVRDTIPNAAFSADASNIGVNELVSPSMSLPSGPSQLSFRNFYDLEAGAGNVGYDGGVLEIKIGAAAFTDILAAGGSFVSGGYTSTIDTNFANPLGGRQAWSGNSGGFVTTLVNLPATAANQSIQLRWRCGTDNGNSDSGWRIDTIAVNGRSCCANSAPILPGQGNRTIAELTTLIVTNTATDDLAQSLTYTLQAPPAGAQINSDGVISWTPTETQGPGTNVITTIVTDDGIPAQSATNSFTVVVAEVNTAPALPAQSNLTIAELATLVVTNTAADSDLPANSLSYTLVSPPAGAVINSVGVITWTPSEAQGPGTNVITTVVTDGGAPVLGATNSFTVVVSEVNTAPSLPAQGNRTIAEQTTLVVTNTATDGDLPANSLSYTLANAPFGAAIDSAGVITWTPTEGQGPSTNVITTVVTDGGLPVLGATNSFMVVVTESNTPPVLPAQGSRTVAELTMLVVTNTATDTDLPANTLSYALVNPPAGATIDSAGVITWAPTEAQGPGTNVITTVVTDGGTPVLGATNSFTVEVTEVNTAPVLAAQGDHTIAELTTLVVTNRATDSDLPANFLSYALVNPPAGATIDGAGIITWTPSEAQGPGTNVITTVVTDGGTPVLGATNSFTVVVTEVNTAPVLTAQSDHTIAELATLVVTNNATDSDLPANTLGYALVNPPAGATIDSAGVITWAPTEAQGPGTNVITTVVTDGGTPVLGATNSFTVVVTEVNTAPVLTAQSDHTIAELATLVVTNNATDSDLPANILSYALVNPPAGATIDGAGIITWTPSEAQGPGTNVITTVVTDGGTPVLGATNNFTVVVTEVNTAPVLPAQQDRTIAEQTTLVVTNTGTDADLPVQSVSYYLLNPPGGAVISPEGVIVWTPSEAQGPGAYLFQTVATDNGLPTLSATNSFAVVVTEVNTAPILPAQEDLTIAEQSELVVTNTATDIDFPANSLSYLLLSAPPGAEIDGAGIITWTPTEAQGPGTNVITTVVMDDGAPPLSATNSFTVVVTEANTAPVLPGQSDRTLAEQTPLVVTNTASDGDLPVNSLGYTLVAAPAGATIDTLGIITWTPTEAQGPSTNTFTTVVTDSGKPALSVTNSFVVVVTEVNLPPVLPPQPSRTISQSSTLVVTNTATDDDLPANNLTYLLLAAPAGAQIDAHGVITWTPGTGLFDEASAFITVVTDDGLPPLSATNTFNVTVIRPVPAPVLLSIQLTNGVVTVTWSAVAGHSYKVHYKNSLDDTSWIENLPSVLATGTTASTTNVVEGVEQRFYRVVLLP